MSSTRILRSIAKVSVKLFVSLIALAMAAGPIVPAFPMVAHADEDATVVAPAPAPADDSAETETPAPAPVPPADETVTPPADDGASDASDAQDASSTIEAPPTDPTPVVDDSPENVPADDEEDISSQSDDSQPSESRTLQDATLPTVSTGSTVSVTGSAASTNYFMSDPGSSNVTEFGAYLATDDYYTGHGNTYDPSLTNSNPSNFSSSSGGVVNFISLSCGTTYHYEDYAINSTGTGVGGDETFVTDDCTGTPPVAAFAEQPEQAGDTDTSVPVSLLLSDDDADTLTVTIQYSLDGGGTWQDAEHLSNANGTGSISTSGNQISGITTNGSSDTQLSFDWDFTQESGIRHSSEVELALTVSDGSYTSQAASDDFTLTGIGGSGTEEDPYLISSCADVENMNDDLEATYALTQNLDCSDEGNDIMVGSENDEFEGTLDGGGHTITLAIDTTDDYAGLFPYVGATITNLRLAGSVEGGKYAGMLAGYSNGSWLRYVGSDGTVTADDTIGDGDTQDLDTIGGAGGLIGAGHGDVIENSYTHGNVFVSSGWYGGGLIGNGDDSEIDRSYSSASVTGTFHVGGLMGIARDGSEITNAWSAGSVSGHAGFVGAFAGNIAEDEGVSLNSDYYDIGTSGGNDLCTSETLVNADYADTCQGVNSDDAPDTGYFKNNDSNAPLDRWNFQGTWVKNSGAYPTLDSNPTESDTDGNVRITVEDAGTQDPIAGATVAIYCPDDGDGFETLGVTDQDGIAQAPAGDDDLREAGCEDTDLIAVRVTKDGYATYLNFGTSFFYYESESANGPSDPAQGGNTFDVQLSAPISAPADVSVGGTEGYLHMNMTWSAPGGDPTFDHYHIQIVKEGQVWNEAIIDLDVDPGDTSHGFQLPDYGDYDIRIQAVAGTDDQDDDGNDLGGTYATTTYTYPGAPQTIDISSCDQLAAIDDDDTYGYAEDYVITSDFSCADQGSFAPLAWDHQAFSGSLDGGGHTISGLTINSEADYTGMFSQAWDASFNDLNLAGTVESTGEETGALVGFAQDTSATNIHSSMEVSGYRETAGLFGDLDVRNGTTNVSDNAVSGLVTSSDEYAAGLVSYLTVNPGATLTMNRNTVDADISVPGGHSAGGLLGRVDAYLDSEGNDDQVTITIQNNGVNGTISSYSGYIGGLISTLNIRNGTSNPASFLIENNTVAGELDGNPDNATYVGGLIGTAEISNAADGDTGLILIGDAYTGPVLTGNTNVGGLIGQMEAYAEDDSDSLLGVAIQGDYSTGDINGSQYLGGLFGNIDRGQGVSMVTEDLYSTGDVHGNSTMGGLAGWIQGPMNIEHAYASGSVIGDIGDPSQAGGLIGEMIEGASITDSFFAGQISGFERLQGAVVGFLHESSLSGVLYDATTAGGVGCAGDDDDDMGTDAEGCDSVNTDESPAASYFLGNDANAPFDSWNFDDIWQVNAGALPTFKPSDDDSGDDDTNPNDVVLTAGSPIASHTTAENAVYTFSIDNPDGVEGEYEFTECGPGSCEVHLDPDTHSVTFTELETGQTYDSITFDFIYDGGDSHSNSLTIDPFTVIADDTSHHSSGGGGSSGSSVPGAGGSTQSQIATLLAQVKALQAKLASMQGGAADTAGVRDLTVGDEGSDVVALQTLLIAQDTGPAAEALAKVGATGFFVNYTRAALAEYQAAHGIKPPAGYFGIITRTEMKSRSLAGLWW